MFNHFKDRKARRAYQQAVGTAAAECWRLQQELDTLRKQVEDAPRKKMAAYDLSYWPAYRAMDDKQRKLMATLRAAQAAYKAADAAHDDLVARGWTAYR